MGRETSTVAIKQNPVLRAQLVTSLAVDQRHQRVQRVKFVQLDQLVIHRAQQQSALQASLPRREVQHAQAAATIRNTRTLVRSAVQFVRSECLPQVAVPMETHEQDALRVLLVHSVRMDRVLRNKSASRVHFQQQVNSNVLRAATTIDMRPAKDPALASCASWGPQLPVARRRRGPNVVRAPQATSATVIVLPNRVPPARTLRQDLTRAVDVETILNSAGLPRVAALPACRGPSRQAMMKPPGRRARSASRGHRVMAPARSHCVLAASTLTAGQRSVRIAVLTVSSRQRRVPRNARLVRRDPSRMAEPRQRGARRVRCAVPGLSVTADMLSRHVVLTRNTVLLGRTAVSRVPLDTLAVVVLRLVQRGQCAQLAQQGMHAVVVVPRQLAQLATSAEVTVRRAHRAGPTKCTVRLLLPIAIDAP